MRQVVVNWARLVVDALEEHIDLTSVRLGGKPEADKQLARPRRWEADRRPGKVLVNGGLRDVAAELDAVPGQRPLRNV